MAGKEDKTIPAGMRSAYIGTAAISAVVVAALCCAVIFSNDVGEMSCIKLFTAVVGMLFAEVLFINCRFTFRENTRQEKCLAAASLLLFVVIFLFGILDALAGIAGTERLIFAVMTVGSIISSVIHLLIWRYQCASMPWNRARQAFTGWIYALVLCSIALYIVNIKTGVLFTVDAPGRINMRGTWIDLASGRQKSLWTGKCPQMSGGDGLRRAAP